MPPQISFRDHPIYSAPLEVLHHLYYYTTQYGLSVAQFTGAHQEFWEKLPQKLRKAKSSSEELDSIIRKLEEYSKGAGKRLKKRREQKDKKWSEKEIVLNAQLLSVLAAFPTELVSEGIRKLTNEKGIPISLRIVNLVLKKEGGSDAFHFVEPDILLLGDRHLIMIELKTRGGAKSSRSYPPSQLLNYYRLIAECQDSKCDGLPTKFSHIILVPSSNIKWVERHAEWVITAKNQHGRFIVDPGNCIRAGSGKTSYNHERVKGLLSKFPIYYRSWEDLENAFKGAIVDFGDKRNHYHWERLCEELIELSVTAGKYK